MDCAFPHHPFSPYLGFVYLSCVFLFVFMDSLKVKSRVFVLVCAALFAILTLYNVYTNTFSQGSGIVFRYGNGYSIERRTIVRSCFIQIFLFSINALYVMFIDKNMELMMNGSGYIYRDTGTGSFYPKMLSKKMLWVRGITLGLKKGYNSSDVDEYAGLAFRCRFGRGE